MTLPSNRATLATLALRSAAPAWALVWPGLGWAALARGRYLTRCKHPFSQNTHNTSPFISSGSSATGNIKEVPHTQTGTHMHTEAHTHTLTLTHTCQACARCADKPQHAPLAIVLNYYVTFRNYLLPALSLLTLRPISLSYSLSLSFHLFAVRGHRRGDLNRIESQEY